MQPAALLRRLRNARRATAALEFALVGPVLVTMMLGTIELVGAVRIQAKLNAAAGQLVEMLAGETSVTEGSQAGSGGSLGDLCTAVSYNMLPYVTTSLSAYIESTTVVQGWGGPRTSQDWASDRACPAAQPIGSFRETILLTNIADTPRSLFTRDGTPHASGGQLMLGYTAVSLQLTYSWSNLVHLFLPATVTFTAAAAARPRANATVSCTYPTGATTTAPCPGVY